MTERTRQILARFPAHLDATRPGKQLAAVVDGLSSGLELLSADLAAVRRAHRIGHADTLRDVRQLGALHGLTPADFAVLFARADRVMALAAKLDAAIGTSAGDRDAAADAVLDLWGVEKTPGRLELFAPAVPEGTPPDLDAGARALLRVVRARARYPELVEAARRRVVHIAAIHANGNGTVRALLEGAANALDLDIDLRTNAETRARLLGDGDAGELDTNVEDGFFHSADLFLHSTFVRDRAPLVRTVPTIAPPAATLLRMGATIAVAEIADRTRSKLAAVLEVIRTLAIDAVKPGDLLSFAEAERVGAALGFVVERAPRGAVSMEGVITVSELARQLGVRIADVVARADGAGADSTLEPSAAAAIARVYGFRMGQRLPTTLDIIGIEENPVRRERFPATQPEACEHGHRFRVVRRGFGREALQVEVTGVETRTIGPMLVNRDEGRGIGFVGAVPAGKSLVLTEEGRGMLDGTDVTPNAYSWIGACFADSGEPDSHDFVFAGAGADLSRRARFVRATPVTALDRDTTFPTGGGPVTPPGIGIGVTRFAFFLQEAHLSSRDGAVEPFTVRRVTPYQRIGFADQSVFADAVSPSTPGADVVLSWLEHEAYALRLIIPQRFALLDAGSPGDSLTVAERVRESLERFRPAGVEVRVDYADDRWTLGRGFAVEGGAEDPNLIVRGGTVLWSSPPDVS